MKKRLFIPLSVVLGLFFTYIAYAAVNAPPEGSTAKGVGINSVMGKWTRELGSNRELTITKSGGIFEGKISKSNKSERIGKKVLTDVNYNSIDKKWQGEMYIIDVDMSFDCIMVMTETDKMVMTISSGILSKTDNFYRVKE